MFHTVFRCKRIKRQFQLNANSNWICAETICEWTGASDDIKHEKRNNNNKNTKFVHSLDTCWLFVVVYIKGEWCASAFVLCSNMNGSQQKKRREMNQYNLMHYAYIFIFDCHWVKPVLHAAMIAGIAKLQHIFAKNWHDRDGRECVVTSGVCVCSRNPTELNIRKEKLFSNMKIILVNRQQWVV